MVYRAIHTHYLKQQQVIFFTNKKAKQRPKSKWVGPKKRKLGIYSRKRGSRREEAILWRTGVPFPWRTLQGHPERLAGPWLCIHGSFFWLRLSGVQPVSTKTEKRIWKRSMGCTWRLPKYSHVKKLKQSLTLFEMN